MTEKNFIIDIADFVSFYGVNDKNIHTIKKHFPALKIVVRADVIKAIGKEDEITAFEEKLGFFIKHYNVFGSLSKKDINYIMENDENLVEDKNQKNTVPDIILHGRNGKTIKALTPNQRKMLKMSSKKDLMFAIGPAGTGKTYTAVAIAVKALKAKQIKRIVLTRPAVEAGENLGFLPGDLKDKLDPYLQPLYDALRDMISHQKLLSYFEDGTIEIAPLAFMRGRTLDHSYVILDEAQNATSAQLKMFLTRMGKSAKFIVTGDVTQIDLPKHQESGLLNAHKRLNKIKEVEFIFLDGNDVVRHPLVNKIIKAYED
jgi:phosphate starvation-inducible protein PhoH and related proteins